MRFMSNCRMGGRWPSIQRSVSPRRPHCITHLPIHHHQASRLPFFTTTLGYIRGGLTTWTGWANTSTRYDVLKPMEQSGNSRIGKQSMSEIFLSASVPIMGRGSYHETANPFLIQCAVRELVIAIIRQHKIVWGGHPTITPMIWNICEDLGEDYSQRVTLYQSRFFEERFPEENRRFQNVIFTEAVPGDREASLRAMREEMLSRKDLVAAVFIGGMEGVEAEYALFKQYHPAAKVLPVPSPGGATLNLAKDHGYFSGADLADVDFARLFHAHLSAQRLLGERQQEDIR